VVFVQALAAFADHFGYLKEPPCQLLRHVRLTMIRQAVIDAASYTTQATANLVIQADKWDQKDVWQMLEWRCWVYFCLCSVLLETSKVTFAGSLPHVAN